MCNHISSQVRDEITYPFFNVCTVKVRNWIGNYILQFTGRRITYSFMFVKRVQVDCAEKKSETLALLKFASADNDFNTF